MGPEHPQAGDLEERDPAQSWAGPRHGGSRCGPWPLTVWGWVLAPLCTSCVTFSWSLPFSGPVSSSVQPG